MNRNRDTRIKYYIWILAVSFCICFPPVNCPAAQQKAKNVIVLIADGCSSEQYTFARWYKGKSLSLDPIRVGAVKTYIADSVVADSAPAASAFATGVRTSDKFISVGPHTETISTVPRPAENIPYRPLATVLEGAKLRGKATGIVSTSRVTHATPAAYAAHVSSRKQEGDIMMQIIHQNMDVVFGGGGRYLSPVVEVLKERGYQIVDSRDEMLKLKTGSVFGLFSDSHLAAEIDRERMAPTQPPLHEMTQKAIELLSRDPDGFFLMVEGSQIDWACHANDPAHLLGELLAYDKAVAVALDFARKNGRTLVLALSDHNTGGFSIGNYKTSATYSQMTPEALLDPFRKMKMSAMMLWKMIEADENAQSVAASVQKGWGMDITAEDAQKILSLAERYKAYKVPFYAIGEYLCPKYTNVGWSSHGHTGGDVPLFAFGPGSPKGTVDGPEIADICAGAMGFDLADINRRLFVEAKRAFPNAGIKVERMDTGIPTVVIDVEEKRFDLPVNRNLLQYGDTRILLEGVVIYAEHTNKAYIPVQAVNEIKTLIEKE